MDAISVALRGIDVRPLTAPLDARFEAAGLRAPRGLVLGLLWVVIGQVSVRHLCACVCVWIEEVTKKSFQK